MALGTVDYVLVCRPNGTNKSPGPCLNIGNVGYSQVMVQAYVLEPSSASFLEAVTEPFDYQTGSAFFLFGFVGVATVYLFSHKVGLILNLVRRN